MNIVLVGAGSVQFGKGMLGDIFASKVLVGSHVVLHDINENTLNKTCEAAKSFIAEHNLSFSVSATTNRKEAFQAADFIISSIEVGDRFTLWEEDWKIPLQYGMEQVYGENGGPGGVFHSLRIIPPILDIMKDVMEICPKAYVFNFSNPMTAICTTVKRVFPQARFIGMCHEIGWLQSWLPRMLSLDLEDIYFKAAGLNHFSCMLEARHKKTGEDLYPKVREKAEAFFVKEPGYSDMFDYYREHGIFEHEEQFEKTKMQKESKYEWADRKIVKFMLENYALLPITVDSHFGEYIGWAADIVDHRGILDFFDAYKIMLTRKQEYKIHVHKSASERVIPIIDGIITNSGYEELAVNVINNGIISNLPDWIAVEVPAIINKDGVQGINLGELPKGYASLLNAYCGVYDLTAEAIIHQKKDYVIQALLANPIVKKAKNVKELVERMIDQQAKWLGYLK